MRKLVLESLSSPRLVRLVNNLWTGRSDITEQLAVVDKHLRSHFRYVPEDIETLRTPEYMVTGKEMKGYYEGDCDDISTLEAAILTGLGIPCRFVVIKSDPNNMFYDHVYVEVRDERLNWLVSDITVPVGTKHEYYQRMEIAI